MAEPHPGGAVAAALEPSGLVPRGWLAPEAGAEPLLVDGKPAKAICLIGHAGGGFWPVFSAWWREHPRVSDPLDSWSKAVIEPVAAEAGGQAVFPSDRPWHPFQAWAMKAEALRSSPLGLLIHPEFGLWHGYRGAILFAETALGDRVSSKSAMAGQAFVHPCDVCSDKPCLSACPVGAFSPDGFAVSNCRSYLRTKDGQQGCMTSGCLAREACPVGRSHRYSPAQLQFHMTSYS
ncbi:ferredoxin [Hoeflea sp.]|uniref:ferredoxin n=1 Tax=Hoeflea sp. TaxID=1940281 RepID=UPI003749EFE3